MANEPGVPFPATGHRQDGRAWIASNKLSLNKGERETEIAADKKRVEDIKKERTDRKVTPPVEFSLSLADVDKPKLERINLDKKDKKDKDKAAQQKADGAGADAAPDDSTDDEIDDVFGAAKPNVVDPIKTESLNILEDMIEQQRHVKLARTRD